MGAVCPWVTHLLFLSLVVDDPVVDRKLSLSPFTFSYYQAFLQAFLQLENRSQQVQITVLEAIDTMGHDYQPSSAQWLSPGPMDTTREGWGLVVGVFARRCVLRVDV